MRRPIRAVVLLLAGLLLPALLLAADQRLEEARSLTIKGRYEKAIRILQPILEEDPRNRTAVVLMGDCLALMMTEARSLAERGKSKKAGKLLAHLIQADPDNREALILRGDCMMEQGREQWPLAVDCYKKAVALDPSDPDVLFKLGVAYDTVMNVDMAFKQYKILRRLDKEKADVLYKLIFIEQ